MKKRKIVSSLLVIMLIMAFSGVSAFADEVAPVVEEPVINEEPATEDSTIVEEPVAEEPEAEVETSYLRFDVDGEDLVLTVEDGVIVSVSNELNLNAEEPAVEEPAVEEPAIEEPAVEEPAIEEPAVEEPAVEEPAVEEPAAEEPAAEEPAVEEPAIEEPAVEEPETTEPVDPYAAYLGLTVTEGVDLILAATESVENISVDIFANGETADGLKSILEEGYAELLEVKTVALDSDNPNAERFLYAAIYKITPGKMNLLEKLGATFEEAEIDYASWSTLSVKEIQEMTKTNQAANQAAKVNRSKEKTSNVKSKAKKK